MTRRQANASVNGLRDQVEKLFNGVLAAANSNDGTTGASLADHYFKETQEEKRDDKDEAQGSSKDRSLLFFAYLAPEDEHARELAGFTRLYEDSDHDTVTGNSLQAEVALREDQREVVLRALFYASQESGEAFAQEILLEKRAKAEKDQQSASDGSSKPLPSSQDFVRSAYAASDFLKKFLSEHGFSDVKFERLEMTKYLQSSEESPRQGDEPVFPTDIEVKVLDLSDARRLRQVYAVLGLAFGSHPPSFEAWKSHYAQHPRFAPELSFVAWDQDEPVSVVNLERIVDGEGGGDDEVHRIYATHFQSLSEKKAEGKQEEDEKPVGEATVEPALEFPADFDERKKKITQEATTAYVCGVGTKLAYRGKGLASNLLRQAFREARKSRLEKVILGTDRFNASAVRAYTNAGMVETKAVASGGMLCKEIPFRHP